MCDTPWHTPDDDDRLILAALLHRPTTPVPPDSTRTLRRTISYASIDTIRPPNKNKGVRRRIHDIAESLKNKSAKKQCTGAASQDRSKDVTRNRVSRSKASTAGKARKRRGEPAAPLRDVSHQPGEDTVLAVADRLHSGVPSEQDTPSTSLSCVTEPLVSRLLPIGGEEPWENDLHTNRILEFTTATTDGLTVFQPPEMPKVDISDLRLETRRAESDVTIWDGLKATHHLYKCRLFLRCTTHLYDAVPIPDIRLLEMQCNTRPITGSHYARPPGLQVTYQGASPDWAKIKGETPRAKLADGIHVDSFWRTTREDDGAWGWYRDAYVPLSSRLFDKMDYREFKLVSKVWLGESCVESESTFGISMLLREVEMK